MVESMWWVYTCSLQSPFTFLCVWGRRWAKYEENKRNDCKVWPVESGVPPHGLLCTHTPMGPVFLSCLSLNSLFPLPRSVLLGLAAVPLRLLCPLGDTRGGIRRRMEESGEKISCVSSGFHPPLVLKPYLSALYCFQPCGLHSSIFSTSLSALEVVAVSHWCWPLGASIFLVLKAAHTSVTSLLIK